MNGKDAATIKVLTDLGLRPEDTLSDEQEELLRRALDPEEEFAHQVKRLFPPKNPLD